MPETIKDIKLSSLLIRDHLLVAKMIRNAKHGYDRFSRKVSQDNRLDSTKPIISTDVTNQNAKLINQWISVLNIDEAELLNIERYKHDIAMQSTLINNALTIVQPIIIEGNEEFGRRQFETLSLQTEVDKVIEWNLQEFLREAYEIEKFIADAGASVEAEG